MITDENLDLLRELFEPALFLSIRQVSQVTGLAEQTLRNLISKARRDPCRYADRVFPTQKLGGRRLVHIADLARWIDRQHSKHLVRLGSSIDNLDEKGDTADAVPKTSMAETVPYRRRKRGRPTKVQERQFRGGRR